MEAIRGAGLKLAVDPLGGAARPYWEPINEVWGLDIDVVNPVIDPTFSFMTVDHDGKIRMDPSSPFAMARLIGLKDKYQVAFANDPDADRHGIVTASAGLMNPNHYLAVAIQYLLGHRPQWPAGAAVGKTLVSSGMIDRIVEKLGRRLSEVPVGFKWFAPGLFDGSCVFGGEESAGASFLRRRRDGLDDRQGRPDHGSPRGRDHGRDGEGPGRPLPRADGGVRLPPSTRGSTPRRRRSRRRGSESSRPVTSRRQASPASRSRRS